MVKLDEGKGLRDGIVVCSSVEARYGCRGELEAVVFIHMKDLEKKDDFFKLTFFQ